MELVRNSGQRVTPEVVFLDVGGTMLFYRRTLVECILTALQNAGAVVDAKRLRTAYRHVRQSTPAVPHPVDLEENRRYWIRFFERTLTGAGVAESRRLVGVLWDCHRSGEWLAPASDTVSTLAALRGRGTRLAVISNWDDTLAAVLARHGLLEFFEHVVASSGAGVAKPDPRIFNEMLNRMNCDPERAWHVGDDVDADALGARAVGITPILLGGNAPPDGITAISTLIDLLDLL